MGDDAPEVVTVLAERLGERWFALGEDVVEALLAHGGHGVAVTPDGRLWALEQDGYLSDDEGKSYPVYRLAAVPEEPTDE